MRAALSKIDGVTDIAVDFDAKTATVSMQPGKTLTREACDKAFEGTHYSVAALEASKAP